MLPLDISGPSRVPQGIVWKLAQNPIRFPFELM